MIHQFTRDEIMAIKSKKAFLIDVRTSSEVADAHSPYAMHFDVQKMTGGELPDIPKNVPVFLYCRSGVRASTAKQILESNGFSEVHNIGGFSNLPSELI